MAATLFDIRERSPQRLFGRKDFSGDKSGPFGRIIATGDLRRECEKQLIQPFLGQKVAHQMRAAFRQDDITGLNAIDRLEDRSDAQWASATVSIRIAEDPGIVLIRRAPSEVVTIKTGTSPD